MPLYNQKINEKKEHQDQIYGKDIEAEGLDLGHFNDISKEILTKYPDDAKISEDMFDYGKLRNKNIRRGATMFGAIPTFLATKNDNFIFDKEDIKAMNENPITGPFDNPVQDALYRSGLGAAAGGLLGYLHYKALSKGTHKRYVDFLKKRNINTIGDLKEKIRGDTPREDLEEELDYARDNYGFFNRRDRT